MFYVVDKSIAIIRPREAFLDWVNQTLTHYETEPLDLKTIQVSPNSYLIPEVEEVEDGISFVDDQFEEIFKMELASWTEDESLWPQDLSSIKFLEWFDVEISPMLIDLSEKQADFDEELASTVH